MEKHSNLQQDEYIILDTLFERLTKRNAAENRIFYNPNKFCLRMKSVNNLVIANEKSFVPDVYTNEFDLFRQYCLNLKQSPQLRSLFDYVEKNFSKHSPNCCYMTGTKAFINQETILNTLTLPEIGIENEVSNKIRFSNQDNVMKTIAVADIQEGETIICEKAYIDVKAHNCLCLNTMNYECSNCWKPVKSFYTCHTCQLCVYCSKACARESENNFHHWECLAQKTHLFGLNDLGHLALRMVFHGFKYNFNRQHEEYKKIYNLRFDLRKFSKDDITEILKKTMKTMAFFSKFTNLFLKLKEIPGLTDRTPMEQFMFLGSILVRHHAQAYINAVFLPLEDYSYVFETRGIDNLNPAICLNICNIQHSCIPNVSVNFRRNYCIIKALQDIKAGEEILLNMNGIDDFQSILVKGSIFQKKQVECNCLICIKQKLWDYNSVVYKCPKCKGQMGHLPNGWKCFDCDLLEDNSEMDEERLALYALADGIKTCRDQKTIIEFLNISDIMLHTQFLLYYFISIRLISMLLDDNQTSNAILHIKKVTSKINSDLHRYSMTRIIVLTAIINCIIKYAVVNTGRCAKSLRTCSKALMCDLEYLSDYYEYTHQMRQLKAAYERVIRRLNNDDEDDDDSNKNSRGKSGNNSTAKTRRR